MTRIVIDSTTDIPADFVDDHRITVLPLHILIDDAEYIDGVTITTHQVYEAMLAGALPKTSQVSIPDSQATLRELAQQGEDVLYLAFSSKMSGTYDVVSDLMEEMAADFPNQKFASLDSRGGSLATGLVTMEAVRMAESGVPFDDLVERCRFLIAHVEHVFVITDLTWLIRGGRISRTLGYTASLLNIKPVLDVDDGEIEVIHKVRGRAKSMRKVADIVAERACNCMRQTVAIAHADDMQAALDMRELLQQRLPDCTYIIEEIGAVLGVHIGIGGVGVFFFTQMDPSAAN
ncbi:MAG: DegV family protein [Eggerthellaceae bacterium]|nr:DegV family protein [Eggerthellaceae bacterium]